MSIVTQYVNTAIDSTGSPGDGTELLPLSFDQVMLQFITNNPEGMSQYPEVAYLLKNQRTLPPSLHYNGPDMPAYSDGYVVMLGVGIYSLSMVAHDLIQYGPWGFIDSDLYPGIEFEFYEIPDNSPSGHILVSGYLGIASGFEMYGQNEITSFGPVEFKNCYFDICTGFYLASDPGVSSIDFYGCTFAGTTPSGSSNPIVDEDAQLWIDHWNPPVIRFYDCVFNTSKFYSRNDRDVRIEFYNCKFNLSQEDAFYYFESDSSIDIVCDDKCEFTFDYLSYYFPVTSSVSVASKDVLKHTEFNIKNETDPVILQRWIDNDYNTGLFGEPRLGVGAFYFGVPEPVAAQPASTIMIPLSSDKCFVLGSKTINDMGETNILVTDFLGYKPGGEPAYADVLLNV